MADVELFTALSADKGIHHLTLDEQGRVIIQGLLTATMPPKIGGDNNVLAQTLNFEFLRPVYTGDSIRCEMTIDYSAWKRRISWDFFRFYTLNLLSMQIRAFNNSLRN